MTLKPLDRRVSVRIENQTVVLPISELRDRPYLVVLGEPGIGKTTALRHEAIEEGGEVLTCREVMNDVDLEEGSTAYLDALDEYRSGENSKDKLAQLANAIAKSNVSRWRLTCRAEDWRAIADMNAMRRAANNQRITVAHLLPLDDEEAQQVLSGLGEVNPQRFTREAHARGAGAFLDSPLSLRLLHSAVLSDGIWPDSRFGLFDRAINALAHEYDPEREYDPRPGAEKIVEAAELMCFYLLASGAKALWRSSALAIGGQDRDHVQVQSLPINHGLAKFSLDTAIFRGEGQSFEPAHRTIAEFLAGRFLARKVTGGTTGVQFPLRRATALITSHDRKAPSELRGLYAWFAAHLSDLGDTDGAVALIEQDAATVLAYGDAAAFTRGGRKAILLNLDRDDPYFLSSRSGTTVLGGLAGADLAQEFISILDSEVNSHLQLTVLQALGEGLPIAAMQSKLHEISLAPHRPLWQRSRACEAWVKFGADETAARRQLYHELVSTPVTYEQVSLRANLLAGIPTKDLRIAEIRQLLSNLNLLPSSPENESETTGALISLIIELKKAPRVDLFDSPVFDRSPDGRGLKLEVRHFLQQTLSAAVSATPDLTANKLWSWVKNTRDYEWDRLEEELARAVGAWIDHDCDRRELELFNTLMDDSQPDEGPWMASNHYNSVARRLPSEKLLQNLLTQAKGEEQGPHRRRLFEVAAYAARSESHWPVWKDRIISALEQEQDFSDLIVALQSDPNAHWKEEERKRRDAEEAKTDEARSKNIAELSPKLNAIAAGNASEYGALSWASNHYRNAIISEKERPLAKIEHFTNARIVSAIAEGFVQYAIHADIEITASNLGTIEAQNRSYSQEYVISAGLHQALTQGREEELAQCSLVAALVGLRHSYFSRKDKPGLATWSLQRLGRDPVRGAEELLKYWNSGLDAGAKDLNAIHHLLSSTDKALASRVLTELLGKRPNLPELALRQALIGCASFLTRDQIRALVETALAAELDPEPRRIWNFIALALEPEIFVQTLSADAIRDALLAPNGELASKFNALSANPDELDRIRIQAFGHDQRAEERDWAEQGSISRIVRAAIDRLSASGNPRAGGVLKALAPQLDPSWASTIAHSAAEHARMMRDSLFDALSVAALKSSLEAGPPANPADLIAIVLEEIERYKRTLRTSSERPWKSYWNTNEHGMATEPRIENECRDRLLELLRSRFDRYGIVASMPEALRGENTRADVLLVSHAGKNLPIEAKRHYNNELWTAPIEQLGGYAADEGACGYGIYLVFWFGTEFPTPARKDGKARPSSANELDALLVEDLPLALRNQVSIIVLDVSRPEAMIAAATRIKKPRKKIEKPAPTLRST